MSADLRERVRQISLDTGETDPAAVAEKLIGELTTAEDLRAALAETLPDYVRRVLGHSWPALPPAGAPPRPAAGQHPGRAVRAAYYAELQRVWFTKGGQKRFGDCGFDDVVFLAADRRRQAAYLERAAEEFDRAAEMLLKHKKAKVAALPRAALDFIFGGAQ